MDGAPSTPDRTAIETMVTHELAEILERSPEDIDPNTPFSDLGADSLALIELVEAIEERLAASVGPFHIDDEDLEGLTSVRDAVDYVTARLQGS